MTLLEDRPAPVADLDLRWRWIWLGAGVVAVLLALLVVGTGSSPTGSSSRTASSGSSVPTEVAPVPAGKAGTTGNAAPALGRSAPAVGTAPRVVGAPSANGPADSARIVKTGQVELVVGRSDVSRTVAAVQAVVLAARGYVSDSTTSESGSAPTATTTFRVPVGSFEGVLAQVRAVRGATVTSTRTSGQDVTGAYADTRAQIQSLAAARSRFLAILAQARTIAETLSVQQRVDDVQGQIDQLQAQRRVLADSSDLSTLTVDITAKGATERRTGGLAEAWSKARQGFASGIEALVAHSGRAAVVLLVVAVLLGIARLVRRRLT